MAQPTFLGDGDEQKRGDTRWLRWVKMLGQYQNRLGALSANNPQRGDSLRVVKQKLLNAVNGTSYTG